MDNFYHDLIGKKSDDIDCYHLVIEMMKRHGYFIPEQSTPESIEMRLAMFEKLSSEYAEPIEKPEPFCIVVFDAGRLMRLHVGVILEDCRSFIHSIAHIKRIRIDRLSSWPWKNRIAGFYRCTKKI